ncbi:hypothetical protein [Acrocarpospora sp. B8E8]|uniref:hypothetical protein n=1 Tax=Acrocarpospora sp. B8E8 TaxID=3153572 RepID=UPI00325F3B4A
MPDFLGIDRVGPDFLGLGLADAIEAGPSRNGSSASSRLTETTRPQNNRDRRNKKEQPP